MRYIQVVAIQSFADGETERFFLTGRVTKGAGWASIRAVAKRKLDMLHYAFKLEDMRSPPGIDSSLFLDA